jgi:AbrB family looped-hinge helix DNA binding protein
MIEVEVKLRRKNQLTLPEEIAERLGVGPGDRLVVSLDEDQPTIAVLRPLLRSYAGILKGVYGTPDEAAE